MLNLEIIHQEFNVNKDKIFHIKVPKNEVIFLGYILEALEGWAYYTTIDVNESIMLVEVIKDYVDDFDAFLEHIFF